MPAGGVAEGLALELEEARLQLKQERVKLEREIECHGDGGRARAVACDEN